MALKLGQTSKVVEMSEWWSKIIAEMLPGLSDQWKLWQLDRKEHRVSVKNFAVFDEAKKSSKSGTELQKLEAELMESIWEIRDERSYLESRMLLAKTNRLGLPVPTEEIWNGTKGLTAEGRLQLRSAIRKEQNERWELRLNRLKVLSLLFGGATGLIGALIGLVSAWKK
jgi:hypothetical protein